MKLILDGTNLLGDSFYLMRAVLEAVKTNPDIKAVVVHPGLAFEMFKRIWDANDIIKQYGTMLTSEVKIATDNYYGATVLRLSAGQAADLSYAHHQANPTLQQMHITEGYAALLGVDLKGHIRPPDEVSRHLQMPRTFFAISPFSRSCSRHTNERPNKTLDDWKWENIIRYLRRQGYPVKVIAGPGDVLSRCSVAVNDYFTAANFDELEEFLAQCKLLVTVDNGLGHVASFLETPMISLWPKVSNMQFIGPLFGKHTAIVNNLDPVDVTPATLLSGIKHFTKLILTQEPQTEALIDVEDL